MKWKPFVCGWVMTLAGCAWADAQGVALTIQENWSNLFTGQEHVYHVAGRSAASFEGQVMWEFNVAGRVIDRGEQAFTDQAAPVAIRLRVPSVKPGVVMQGTLTVSFVPAGRNREAVKIDRPVWLFSPEAFADKTVWMEGLRVRLFDPAEKTAALFSKEKIPFEEIRNVDAIPGLTGGLLVIGEGLSLRDYKSLFLNSMKAASTGVAVLFLAPADGDVEIPVASGPEILLPGGLAFRGLDVLSRLDKRLDASAWAPDGRIVSSSLTIRGERGPVVGEFRKDSSGWPWIELNPAQGSGRLVICGFAIVSKWADSPAPRYLFLKLLEETNKESK